MVASFSSFSLSRSRCVDATVSWSFLHSISSIWLQLCAACTDFSKLTFSLQCWVIMRGGEQCDWGATFTYTTRSEGSEGKHSVCKPGQCVSFLLQSLLFSQCGLLLSLGSIPLSLQNLDALFHISFGQICLWKLLAQLLYWWLGRDHTASNILQT